MNLRRSVDFLECSAVVPGQPVIGVGGQRAGVLLQFGEVVEGINVVEFAGVNQAHKQIAHPRPVQRLKKVRIFAMQNRFFEGPFANVVI